MGLLAVMKFTNLFKIIVGVFYIFLLSGTVAHAEVYARCINSTPPSGLDLCYEAISKTAKDPAGKVIRRGNYSFNTLFADYSNNEKSFISYKNGNREKIISISPQGYVLINWKQGDRFNTNKNYKNTFTGIRSGFFLLSQFERLRVQRKLQNLNFYGSSIDGKWGKETFSGILAYNTVFNREVGIADEYAAFKVLRQILGHTRFAYNDGPIKKEKDNTEAVAGYNSKKSCVDTPIYCRKDALCEEASYVVNGTKYWREAARPQHVKLAKQRGLTCGVVEQKKVQASAQNCDADPKYCGVVQLCAKATLIKNGNKVWRTDIIGKPYASAAQSIGVSCNVDKEADEEQIYRVANGTGFFVSDDGYVVTNQHVISGCNEVQVHSDGRMAATTIISQDKINDLALLQTKVTPKAKLKFASENPYLLQDIIAAGFPFGESISSTIKVTKGVVSSLSGLGDNSGQIQIDAALQPGNSGGPIIDENGNVVGVAVAKLDLEKSIESFGVVPENVNFGIKLSNLKSFLDGKNVAYEIGQDQKINNSTLGRLATDATVLISCWMTEARIETMQNQKAMFKEILK